MTLAEKNNIHGGTVKLLMQRFGSSNLPNMAKIQLRNYRSSIEKIMKAQVDWGSYD